MPRFSVLFLAVLFLMMPGCVSDGTPVPAASSPSSRPASSANRFWSSDSLTVPSDSELIEQIAAALDFRLREDFDRSLDARDPGELLEHATLLQIAVDRETFEGDALFVVGDELFDYEFRPEQGLGNALGGRVLARAGSHQAPNLRRVHQGEFGGPDSHSCSTCHFKGGPDGAGNNTQNAFLRGDGQSTLTADERNPPHLLGLGPIAALAREMTADLNAQRKEAVEAASKGVRPAEVVLESKGVRFGTLKAHPGGKVDTGGVEGVDPDLVVKPFGWKGHQATLRGMVEESFRIHLGIVSVHDQQRVRDGKTERTLYGDGKWYDIDRDGSTIELDEGMLTTMVAYLVQLEVPVIRPPQPESLLESFARGRLLFDEVGCSNCHRPLLELKNAVFEVRPRGSQLADRTPIRINVAHDGDQPKIEPRHALGTTFNVPLFSDLRRHDMGSELATPSEQNGIATSVFLTRPLWGLAFTSPYLHDGRAPTVDDAIRLHGGEGTAARDRYLELGDEGRAALEVFLLSLDREPELFVP